MPHYRNKCGTGYVPVCIITVVIAMFAAAFISFAASVGVVSQIKDNTKTVLDSYVTEKSVEIYGSIKQGTDTNSVLDSDEYCNELRQFCTFAENDGKLYHYNSEGETDYYMSLPELSFDEASSLKVRCEYTVYIPVFFAGHQVGTATVPITIKSRLTSKN